MSLKEKDISESLERGTEEFTKHDLKEMMSKEAKANGIAKKHFSEKLYEDFLVLWSLLRDYWDGKYTHVPWKFIASIGFAVAYMLSPIDIIFDFIPVVGFADDIALFVLVITKFRSEIDAYKEWKKRQNEN